MISAFIKRNILFIAWAEALIAMLGSLYFSEVQHFTPCVLCWYQRIFLYPLVLIIGVGILLKEKKLHYYVLPLSLFGMGISIYHNLLYYKVIPESLAPCVAGISCTTKFIYWFGFISIPLLALAAFTIITICMLVYRSTQSEQRS